MPGVFTHAPDVPDLAIVAGGTLLGAVISFAVWHREALTRRWQPAAQLALTGVLLLMLTWRHGATPELLIPVGFTVAAVPLALLDLHTGRLPNWLLLVACLLTLTGALIATLAYLHTKPLVGLLLGAAVFGGFYTALYVFLPGHMGGGDLKLSVIAGAALGWQSWSWAVSASLPAEGVRLLVQFVGVLLLIWLLNAVSYLVARAVTGRRVSAVLRHGPFLALGTVLAVLLQP